ncbi:NAD-dependent epimerase/dehydratase family protein [Sphingobacterium bambusae]|uniref:NAD-dependent epimerase/dehydratase family protein n=1 Tax=Sphingobacterium bambusae TaxID=662858 RepID=A0ABW6BE38_9SPHI|nr:NAD-dependent epimerase/dehydratase family protein [Sphingobacterium bambusae]WPL46904.1 NAD-dependent epimerase/dehydratase family protein [Sphingobacterium bambusae]
MQYKKILVTGAAGFIGFHVCRLLLEQGLRVVGLDNINDYYDPQLKYARLQALGLAQRDAKQWNSVVAVGDGAFRFIRMNIEDRAALPAFFAAEKCDAVIHLAAQAGVRHSLKHPEAYVDSNIVGFLNVLECCRQQAVQHLLYASSSSVYGENAKVPFAEDDCVDYPVSIYAATKKANELMAHSYSHLFQLPTTGLRFFTVYGPWGRPDMAPMLFASAIAEGREIHLFNHGEMSRDFTYIDDICQGIYLALQHPQLAENPYQILNVGNGKPVQLADFIAALESAMGKTTRKKMLPMQVGEVPRTWADTSKLAALGYASKTLVPVGVQRFVDWYRGYNANGGEDCSQ